MSIKPYLEYNFAVVSARLVSFLLTIAFVGIFGLGASYLARGYRLDTKNLGLKPTGLLVATSSPDGAQILINTILESATNATLSLPPDSYDVEIKKEGFLTWRKRLTIKKEEVTKVDAALFPAAPSLSALTFGGAVMPVTSPDGTRVVFGVPKSADNTKLGLWVMDLGNLPIGFSSDPRQITNLSPETSSWSWSPDSRQVLVTTQAASGIYLLPAGSYTADRDLVNIRGAQLEKILAEWQKEKTNRREDDLDLLPSEIRDLLERKTQDFVFSPDENKVLYVASASASLKEEIIPQLPGSSTQKQERSIKQLHTYVYDIKEDRNFYITDAKVILSLEDLPRQKDHNLLSWFSSSDNVVLAEQNKVTIMDYDGTNRQVIWSGPYNAPYAIPAPNGQRLFLLTPLGAGSPSFANIYALSLK